MENNKSVLIDDKKYWKTRHEKTANLKASGIKSVGVKSNEYIYKILEEQYAKLLNQLELVSVKSAIDCGFGDGYFLKFFIKHFPNIDIHGIDISQHAKDKIEFKQDKLFIGDIAGELKLNKQFDIVHCFDVLYHILDDKDHDKALKNLTKLSKKYVILHERFLDKAPAISSKHVRMRSAEYTNQVLNSQGFFLHKEMPTHFYAMRVPIYKLNKIVPGILYEIDNFIANKLHPSTQESLASHKIRVYVKAEA